jgi:hypothetical protein
MDDKEIEGNELPNSGLRADEQIVMNSLIAAWEGYVKLPVQHPSDQQEFLRALHECQRLLAIRIVRRAYREYWRNEDDTFTKSNVPTQVR